MTNKLISKALSLMALFGVSYLLASEITGRLLVERGWVDVFNIQKPSRRLPYLKGFYEHANAASAALTNQNKKRAMFSLKKAGEMLKYLQEPGNELDDLEGVRPKDQTAKGD